MKQIVLTAIVATLVLLSAGCVTFTAADIVISPPSLKGEKWTLSGTEASGTLTVRINGNPILQGPVSYISPTSLNASYEGHTIQTVCPIVGAYASPYCQVYVDGMQAATLFFGRGGGQTPAPQAAPSGG